jgi:hypothetical protein
MTSSVYSLAVCTTMVYRYVRSIDTSSLKYRFPQRFSYLNTTQVPAVLNVQRNSFSSSSRRSVTFNETNASGREQNQLSDVLEEVNEDDDENSKSQSDDISEEEIARLRQVSDGVQGDRRAGMGESSVLSFGSQGRSMRGMVDQWKTSRIQYREEYKRTLEVYHQSLYYLGTFYLTHVWSTSNRIVQFANGGNSYFSLTAIHSFFDPLQGFLNYFVYQRPRYIGIRKEYPKSGRIAALYRMLRFSYMPEPKEWAAQEVTTNDGESQKKRDDTGASSSSAKCGGARTNFTGAMVSSLASSPSENDAQY